MYAAPRLLVVAADAERRMVWTTAMESVGFDVVDVPSGREAVRLTQEWKPHALLCSWSLEGLQKPFDLLRFLRDHDKRLVIAVVGVIADSSSYREVIDAGADMFHSDDYREELLVTEIEMAVKRRANTPTGTLHCGDLTFDIAGYRVWLGECELSLTTLEFRLLVTLAEHCGEVVSRPTLMRAVWRRQQDLKMADQHLVDVHIATLRKKLLEFGSPPIIRTVRSQGYVLRP